MRYAVTILEDFTEGNARKSQKAIKTALKNHIYFVLYNSRLKPKILSEVIVEHYLTIACYI